MLKVNTHCGVAVSFGPSYLYLLYCKCLLANVYFPLALGLSGFVLLLALIDGILLRGFIMQLVRLGGRGRWVDEIPNQLSLWGKGQR